MSRETSNQKYFTKHLFHSGCICPTKLYYKAHSSTYPEKEEQQPFLDHIRYNKYQMRALLELVFPSGSAIESRDYLVAARETKKRIKQESTVLFNATVEYDSLIARFPVVEKEGERLRLFELKTRGFDPARHSLTDKHGRIRNKWKRYIIDYAYQLYVIGKQYPKWELEPYLVMPDKTATTSVDLLDKRLARGGEVETDKISGLLAFVPVMDEIQRVWSGKETLFEEDHPAVKMRNLSFEEIVHWFVDWYLDEEKVYTKVGKKCASCEYRVKSRNLDPREKSGFEECWNQVLGENNQDKSLIFDLIGSGNGQLIEDQIYLQQEVNLKTSLDPGKIARSDGRITDYHRRVLQVSKAQNKPVPKEIIKPQLLEELKHWTYPIHFLDFEAGSYAIPLRAGCKPYHQVVFQYSSHTLYEDGTLEHHEWLHDGGETYPNFELINELRKIPDFTTGTIVHYSGFESSALHRIQKEMQNESSEYIELGQWTRDLLQGDTEPKMMDMGKLVKNYYYNDQMENSLSIKDVLRAIMTISPFIKRRFTEPYNGSNFNKVTWWQEQGEGLRDPYEILCEQGEEAIGRGTEAMVGYSKLRSGSCSDEEQKLLMKGLLSYCELDTLAMVMIYLHWEGRLHEKSPEYVVHHD